MKKIIRKSGFCYPLGSTFDGKGTNFSLFSANAEKVELCLFDKQGKKEFCRFEILQNDHNIWHIYLEGIEPGQVYGYRVYGPYVPKEGKRFNENKLLIDPYAKKLIGELIWHKAIFGYDVDSKEKDLSFSKLDSAPYVPKSVVIDDRFDFEDEKRPAVAYENTLIYEMHVKSYTALFPKLKDVMRGTFKGLSSQKILTYLKWLGITTVELMPIHAFFGRKKGNERINYWGYETLSFFALEKAYLGEYGLDSFKQMIKAFHENGQEVVLDVVYNHTIEGNELGPTLCYKGIDNESYYTLDKENKRFYYDSTGCGSLFNIQNPNVLTLVMDSMRYFVKKMHIDGFRLDLASSLSREKNIFKYDSAFLSALRQDETLRKVKIIAEPWDVGMGGYQIGAFPPGFLEWNDRFRDVVRRFWRGDERQIGEFASRIAGSSDIFGYHNRNLWSSVNFITSHDGFSLKDLVSFNRKHNESNGENNKDGSNDNWSFNSGFEGLDAPEDILQNRLRRAKALMATLLFSFGTPMISSGDEFLKTQFGSNNPYAQDNIISYIAWDALDKDGIEFVKFTKKLIKLRQSLKVFHKAHFFTGKKVLKSAYKDLAWYDEDGSEFIDKDWQNASKKAISYLTYEDGELLYVIFNANSRDIEWQIPKIKKVKKWLILNDTSSTLTENVCVQKKIDVSAWSVVVMKGQG